jgi:hypothetical protein
LAREEKDYSCLEEEGERMNIGRDGALFKRAVYLAPVLALEWKEAQHSTYDWNFRSAMFNGIYTC